MSEYIKFATKLAKEAGDIMLEYFESDKLNTEYKEGNQPVTVADKKINQLVIDSVKEKYPKYSVLGEEGSIVKDSDYSWVCDPIDGTIPFMKGIPVAVFSLALVNNGKPILGVVFDPFQNKMYTAEQGMGAFCNDEEIMVSRENINKGIINIEWWQDGLRDVVRPLHNLAIQTQMYDIHIPSIVYASALVAKGKIEASVFVGGKGKNVDIAAIKIIVEEAGGKVTDLDGNEQRYDQDINGAIISNSVNHQKLVDVLKIRNNS